MFIGFLGSIVGVFLLVTSSYGTVLFCGFETGVGSPNDYCSAGENAAQAYKCCSHSRALSSNYAKNGTQSLRLNLRGADLCSPGVVGYTPCDTSDGTVNADRTEYNIAVVASPPVGLEYWYGASLMVPVNSGTETGEGWVDTTGSNAFEIFSLTLTTGDSCDVTNWPQELVVLERAPNGDIKFRIYNYETECTPSSTPLKTCPGPNCSLYTMVPMVQGNDESWVFKVLFSTRNGSFGSGSTLNSDGNVQVWRDGALVVNFTGKVGVNNVAGNIGLRLRLYKSQWENLSNTVGDKAVLYFDDVRFCDQAVDTCDFEAVDPDQTIPPLNQVPVFSSCAVSNTNPNMVDVTLADDGATILPATSCTGFTPSMNGVSGTVVSCNRLSSFVDRVTFYPPGNFGDVIGVSYSPGNVTDDDSEALESFTTQQCSTGIGPNLLNSSMRISDSGNFSNGTSYLDFTDGIVTQTTAGSVLGIGEATGFIEYDLGQSYEIQNARLFGDDTGSYYCSTWKLEYKVLIGEGYTTAFSGQDCHDDKWFVQGGSWTGRYFKVTWVGPAAGFQVREGQLYGTQAAVEGVNRVMSGKGTLKGGMTLQ